MSYRKRGRKFGRVTRRRSAFLTSLIRALILNERIYTTEARAKSIRPLVEKLITTAREANLHDRRRILSYFANETMIATKLIDNIAPRYNERPGGYTRITKVFHPHKDARKTAVIEFV